MTFAKALAKLRRKAKMTQYRLSVESGVDCAYIWRLETGQSKKPSRRVVRQLGQSMLDNSGDVTLEDIDRLLKAAGHGTIPKNLVSIHPHLRNTRLRNDLENIRAFFNRL